MCFLFFGLLHCHTANPPITSTCAASLNPLLGCIVRLNPLLGDQRGDPPLGPFGGPLGPFGGPVPLRLCYAGSFLSFILSRLLASHALFCLILKMSIWFRPFMTTRTSGTRYPPQLSKDQNLEVRGEDFPRKKYFLQTKVCHVRVTVDLPTFCLVTVFSVESKELELELEQPKKNRHPCNYQRTWTLKIHTEKIR
jgi:hypothetical protein